MPVLNSYGVQRSGLRLHDWTGLHPFGVDITAQLPSLKKETSPYGAEVNERPTRPAKLVMFLHSHMTAKPSWG